MGKCTIKARVEAREAEEEFLKQIENTFSLFYSCE